jgi:DNA topoisomerase-2
LQAGNSIQVWNNGNGVPVEMHKKEGVYVPELIFGHLLTSSNYNDQEEKVCMVLAMQDCGASFPPAAGCCISLWCTEDTLHACLLLQITGGRNGYGAKLTNIFSTEFTIETCDGSRAKRYKQVHHRHSFHANVTGRLRCLPPF